MKLPRLRNPGKEFSVPRRLLHSFPCRLSTSLTPHQNHSTPFSILNPSHTSTFLKIDSKQNPPPRYTTSRIHSLLYSFNPSSSMHYPLPDSLNDKSFCFVLQWMNLAFPTRLTHSNAQCFPFLLNSSASGLSPSIPNSLHDSPPSPSLPIKNSLVYSTNSPLPPHFLPPKLMPYQTASLQDSEPVQSTHSFQNLSIPP